MTVARSPLSRTTHLLMLLMIAAVLLGSTGCSWRKKKGAGTESGNPDDLIVPPPPPTLISDNMAPRPPEPVPGFTAERIEEDIKSPDSLLLAEPDQVGSKPAGTVAELQTVYFAFDSSELSDASRTALDQNAQWLRQYPNYEIQIEGHCDSVGTTEYNLALGDKRAKNVKAYLIMQGVEPTRLHTISYGEERPIDTTGSPEGMSRNRRAMFLVY